MKIGSWCMRARSTRERIIQRRELGALAHQARICCQSSTLCPSYRCGRPERSVNTAMPTSASLAPRARAARAFPSAKRARVSGRPASAAAAPMAWSRASSPRAQAWAIQLASGIIAPRSTSFPAAAPATSGSSACAKDEGPSVGMAIGEEAPRDPEVAEAGEAASEDHARG